MQAIARMKDLISPFEQMLSSYMLFLIHSISWTLKPVPGLICSALRKLRYSFEMIKNVVSISLRMK